MAIFSSSAPHQQLKHTQMASMKRGGEKKKHRTCQARAKKNRFLY